MTSAGDLLPIAVQAVNRGADLAWVANGYTGGTVILGNDPWDTAAGAVIAREAGA